MGLKVIQSTPLHDNRIMVDNGSGLVCWILVAPLGSSAGWAAPTNNITTWHYAAVSEQDIVGGISLEPHRNKMQIMSGAGVTSPLLLPSFSS